MSWRDSFLDELRRTGSVTVAAELAGVHRVTAHAAKRRDADFASAWQRAEAERSGRALEEIRRRVDRWARQR